MPASATPGAKDDFIERHLPPRCAWPQFRFDLPDLIEEGPLNAAAALLDSGIREAGEHSPAVFSAGVRWSYGDLRSRTDAIAHVLRRDLGLKAGERVLLRGGNSPMMIAAWLAVLKAGGVAVTTMPLLRTKELTQIIEKGRVNYALCAEPLIDELAACRDADTPLKRLLSWNGTDGELEALMERHRERFDAAQTSATDPAILAFTSGTTGPPKACVHFHRDIMAMAETFARHILAPKTGDVFCGTPPIAFTFGLGGSVVFPFRFGAATAVFEKATPSELVKAIGDFGVTTLFTSPTAYRAMLPLLSHHDISTLHTCVSAGETLPKATFDSWEQATGLKLIDGIGSTEMIHIFISARPEDTRAGYTGKPIPGYEACLLDDQGNILPPGSEGRLAVRGPTGCRYLDDPRQREYVQGGWNITGDIYRQDEDGYFAYVSRADDMIVSSGYNIAGPEVEDAVLSHEAVLECAVVGTPDPERGSVVKAFVVLKDGHTGDDAMRKTLQDWVKSQIAPYKYPRQVEFVSALPKTGTGKVQRFALRQRTGG